MPLSILVIKLILPEFSGVNWGSRMIYSSRLIGAYIALSIASGIGFATINLAFAGQVRESGVLDGKVFFGKIGKTGQSKFDDKLSFADGRMWSEICIRCGYLPGKYWTRIEDGNTAFRSEIISEMGVFVYQGRVVDGQVKAEVTWSKERWYWTSSQSLAFKGSTKSGEFSSSATQASDIATDALKSKFPDWCW
jgi:hypothetical protein